MTFSSAAQETPISNANDMAEISGDIAIIGMSCRFPGEGEGVKGFWESISSGQYPPERFHASAFWTPHQRSNTSATRGGFFLSPDRHDPAAFDAAFFLLPKAEAAAMDPQQRLLVEVAYEALESAGVPLCSVAGSRTGVYVGVFTHDYYEMLRKDAESLPALTMHGTASTAMAGRLSWLWDLRGPSFALDTACSSSLVALHLAVQGLRTGEADAALVGGTNLLLAPDMFKVVSSGSFLAPDGRSKAFDAAADGYGRGEGVGVLMLKRVEDAVRDGDPIRAVIRGTACNQDGRTPGMTLPSSEAQAALIRDAYRTAGVEMKDTGYVEAHGTGTQAGDREETTSLSLTIASAKKQAGNGKLLIGSVKSNIGHLEAAAGIAALIKTVLVLEHGVIPPTISVKTLNPKIPFAAWNLSVPTTLTPFPGSVPGLRRASVNSFGFCGTNAHAILDDAYSYLQSRGITGGNHFTQHNNGQKLTNGVINNTLESSAARHPLVFALSAQDRDGIKRVRQTLSDFLLSKENHSKTRSHRDSSGAVEFLVDLAHTLNTRRTHHQWKSFAVAASTQGLADALKDKETPRPEHLAASRPPRLGFVFTGQGAQWAGMGMELMAAYPLTFGASVAAADAYLRAELGCEWPAEEELRRPKAESKLGIAEYSQPLCTVLQVALVDLLGEWGIKPAAVTGHSSGEMGAAYALGALSREDAWKVACYRGVLSAEGLRGADGAMMAVGTSPERAAELIRQLAPGQVAVACINSPSSVTLSGDSSGIDKLLAALTEEGIFARKLQVDTAYHSHHMQMIASDYMDAILDMQTRPGVDGCVMQSSAAGTAVTSSDLGPAHWVRNLVSPVQFARAVQDLVRPRTSGTSGTSSRATKNAVDILIEIGPHSALQGPSLQSLKATGVTDVPYLTALSRWEDGRRTCLALAGDLFARSFPVDLSKANNETTVNLLSSSLSSPRKPKALVNLPSYPWNHQQRHWAETRWAREQRLRRHPPLALLGAPLPSAVAGEHAWRGYLRMREQPWVADHQIQGSVLYPGAGFLAMAIEAAAQVAADSDQGHVPRLPGSNPVVQGSSSLPSTMQARQVRGFRLRHVQFVLPMVLHEDRDVEYTVVLRPHLTGTLSRASTWAEFVTSSSPDGVAFERNCLGLILVEYADNNSQAQAQAQDLLEAESMRQRIDEMVPRCGTPSPPSPSTRTSTPWRSRRGRAGCWARGRAAHWGQRPHVIHPALLDAVFHTMFAAASGSGDLRTAMVPKTIESVVVSMDAPYRTGEQLRGVCEARPQGFKEYMADISMEDSKTRCPVLQVQGLCCTKVAGDAPAGDVTAANSLCTEMVWRPHLDLLDHNMFAKLGWSPTGAEGSALSKLSEMIRLMHHANPALSLVEVATSDQIILPKLDLDEGIFATTTYQMACSETTKPAVAGLVSQSEQPTRHKVLDLHECLASEKFSVDLIIATHDGSEESQNSIEALFVKLPAKWGRVCLVDRAPTKDIGPQLRAAKLEASLVLKDDDYAVRVISRDDGYTSTEKGAMEEIVVLSSGEHATTTETKLVHELQACGFKPVVVSWSDATAASAIREKRCISLVELERPLLENLGERDFIRLVEVVENALHISWVVGSDEDEPASAMMPGVLRVLHNEMPGLEPVSISVDASSLSRPDELAAIIARVFAAPMGEREFRILDGVPHICRVVPDEALNDNIEHLSGPKDAQEPKVMSYGEAVANGRPLRLAIGKPGQLDSVRFQVDDAPEKPLLPDEVEIDVQVSALNFRDVMSIMALLPTPTLGIEAAGTVRRVGFAVTHLHISERVALVGKDAHASVMRGKASHAFKIPAAMTLEQAAALPIVSYTAWYGLVHIAQARKGQTVLIHAGTGGVGQAALQLARDLGLEVFTTVSSEAKRELPRSRLRTGVMKMTGGRGVDVVLNSLAGEALIRSWECIAPSGHFVEIGLRDIVDNTRLGMRPFMRGASFTSVNLQDLCDNQTELMAEVVEGTRPYLVQGIVKPAGPLVSYPVSDLVKALRLLQSGKHTGKLVLSWTPDAQIPVLRSPAPPLRFGDGVVLLSGGMGGLGRSIARMLATHGARKLCFLSRSAGTSAEARHLLEGLAEQGVQTKVLACDVSEPASLTAALDRCKTELGPVRGVFQCAAALRDALFTKMTYSEWTESTRSKVQGSRNLSDALPDVDFFVLLSSYAGVFGNRGQSNYAAGCSFQDALAASRRARGQSAVSVDLGQMRDVGTLAESGAQGGHQGADEMGIGARVVTGLGTRAGSLAAGIEPPYYFETDPRFGVLALVGGDGSHEGVEAAQSSDEQLLSAMIPQAATVQDAASLVLTALVGRVAKMMDLSPSDLDTGRVLHSYGVDSLAAIEIVNWALRDIQARIAVFDVMAAVPMAVFCERVAARSGLLPKSLIETS
ncbi:hypothetical protein PG996_013026 [Apiospora saccharicola]|uniref:Polyketide synthase n=1 Tax=Apiospora saccharicola TaxID=335842 RepID=A0ABR1U4C2_9PEZI